MNCIIVDDDKMSRKVLEEFIKRTDSLNLINTFTTAVEAINSLKTCEDPIHIIFLDIEMPVMNGIEFLNTFKEVTSQIIIVSAKDKYAITAFEYDVTDYLLKPISYARFYKSIDRAFKRMDDIVSIKHPYNQKEDTDEIFIKKSSTLVRLKYDDILYIEALENYVIVTTYNEKYTIHFTMKSIEDKLPLKKFKRVHRSFIVNINKIKGIEDNSIIIKLGEGIKLIPVGKSYKEKLLSEINIIVK